MQPKVKQQQTAVHPAPQLPPVTRTLQVKKHHILIHIYNDIILICKNKPLLCQIFVVHIIAVQWDSTVLVG